MNKIIINKTNSDIYIKNAGVKILANSNMLINTTSYAIWSSDDVMNEVIPHLVSGNLVVSNDGLELDVNISISHLERIGGIIDIDVNKYADLILTGYKKEVLVNCKGEVLTGSL